MLRLKTIKCTNDYFSLVCILHSCEQGFEPIALIFAFSPSLSVAPDLEFSSSSFSPQLHNLKIQTSMPKSPKKLVSSSPSTAFSLFQDGWAEGLSQPAARADAAGMLCVPV